METDWEQKAALVWMVTEDVFSGMTFAVTINEKHSEQWEEREEKSYTSDSWSKLTQGTVKASDKHYLN